MILDDLGINLAHKDKKVRWMGWAQLAFMALIAIALILKVFC